MKVNELMVGDWVKVNGLNLKVGAIHADEVGVYDSDCKIYWCSNDGLDRVDPITLTEDILVKNGFQKLNDKTFLLKNQIEIEVGTKFSEVSARYEDYDRDYNSYNNRYIEIAIIHYVHQLQHLLRLCGIEKELVIDEL